MIKNLSGQEFANFDAWKEWAEECNIYPDVVEFLTFYPWIIKENEGAQDSEEFSNKLKEMDSTDPWGDRSLDILKSTGYKWADDYYNFKAMKLLPNGDGTYTLVHLCFKDPDHFVIRLRIPESVSHIEYNALKGTTVKVITFPDNFASTSPFHVSFTHYPLVYTRHPLNIEYKAYGTLENGYFDLPYTTFRRLCSVWPSAFEGEYPLIGDRRFLREGGHLRRISNDSVYAAYSPSNALQLHDLEHPISSKSDEVPLDECKVVAMEILPKNHNDKFVTDIITVPESVEVLIVNRQLKELIILGNPKYVYLDVVPDKVKVNAKITEVRSQTLKEAYREYGYERVVFNLPDLCGEESVNAGYIRVTAAEVGRYERHDRVVEINADHIVLMSPETILYRDRPVCGTRVHLAWNGNEQSFLTVLAYEPMDMIAEKINKAKTSSK